MSNHKICQTCGDKAWVGIWVNDCPIIKPCPKCNKNAEIKLEER